MGRKKNHQKKATKSAPPNAAETNTEDDSGFAASLLSSMGINPHQTVEEEAVDDTTSEDTKIKHPHLHSIHQSIKSVFKRSSSDESQSSNSSEASATPEHTSSSAASNEADHSVTSKSHSSHTHEHLTAINETKEAFVGNDDSGDAKKRRNRRKEKLAERERERARIVQEAQAEVDSMPDKRSIELKGMGMMISKAGLVEHEVQPDGHCLFHSLCDQLQSRLNIKVDYQELRGEVARFIRDHPDDFVPYLIDEETGNVQDVQKYTDDLEHTAMWGGELEIMAASRLYRVPIKVYFGSQAPLTVNDDQFPNEMPLTLAYYQDKFGLGAHYNSLVDAEVSDSNEAAA